MLKYFNPSVKVTGGFYQVISLDFFQALHMLSPILHVSCIISSCCISIPSLYMMHFFPSINIAMELLANTFAPILLATMVEPKTTNLRAIFHSDKPSKGK